MHDSLDVHGVIVHEWWTKVAGSEKVVEHLRRVFPTSTLVTSMYSPPQASDPGCVRTSFLQRFATAPGSHVRWLPLVPLAMASVSMPEGDVYVTSFHTFSLYARIPRGRPHLVYCHTPPRFLWRTWEAGSGRSLGLAQGVGLLQALRRLDRWRAARPARWVANSHEVARRIRDVYGMDATVVHPPVDIDRFRRGIVPAREDFYLLVSRLVPYKRVDLAVEAFRRLGRRLVIAGSGRSEADLRRQAPPNVEFLGYVSDEELVALMRRARALVFPGLEDFGIVMAEAQAAGTPVVAFGAGGARDIVVNGATGVLFETQDSQSLSEAIREFEGMSWDHRAISASAERFRPERFAQEMGHVVGEEMRRYQ